jgi:hypothetical protein
MGVPVPVHPPTVAGATVITSLIPLATWVPIPGVRGGLNVKVVLKEHVIMPVPLVTLVRADAGPENTASPATTQSNAIAILIVCRRLTSATPFWKQHALPGEHQLGDRGPAPPDIPLPPDYRQTNGTRRGFHPKN